MEKNDGEKFPGRGKISLAYWKKKMLMNSGMEFFTYLLLLISSLFALWSDSIIRIISNF